MILEASGILDLFNAVKSDKHNSEDKSVLIFVANGDVDSMCTSIQLESILGKADIHSSILPVESYNAISEACQRDKLEHAEELKTIFLINCGATEDIRSVCKLSPNVRVIIIDSHRPVWHGYKTQDQDIVVVLDDDDPVHKDEIPEFKPDEDLIPDERSDDDLSSSDDEPDSEAGSDKDDDADDRSGRDQDDDHDAGSRREGQLGDTGDTDSTRKRRAAEDRRRAKRAKRQEREQLDQEQMEHRKAVEAYYMSKAGYGKPSALLLLGLAKDQQEDDTFHIWLAILGITDHYIHQRIDPLKYNTWRQALESSVAKHNNAINIPDQGGPDDDDNGLYNNKARHKLTVRSVKDLKIPLLRHWNLFEALQYTHHVATRMQTWRDVGCKQLELFLTAMNVMPSQRNNDYMSMHPEVMPLVQSKLQQTAGQFRLAYEALKYRGFEMQYKNDVKILATDYVLAITAMLGRSRNGCKSQHMFREAVNCLYPHRSQGWAALQEGFTLAKQLAQAVVQEGGLVITRGQVQGGKQAGVWVCDLSELTMQNAKLLEHPTSLLRLAFFLRDARAQRLNTVRPLVVVGPMNAATGMCYVVAIRATQQAGVMQNNPFAVPFQEALRDLGAGEDASAATFDNAVFLIKKPAAAAFIEELKKVVQAYRAGVDDARMV